MKAIYLLFLGFVLALVPLVQCQGIRSDIDKMQKVLEGLFAYNNLSGPFMFKYCFDD